ncbi:MAG: ATP-binding protein [Gemmatimonadota bacterium]|nr:ATP-binding protein [Gemmatimonadota bacterium]
MESGSRETSDRVSSPAATGGAGTFFEQHVAAYWLALLLVRGIPPILRDCTLDEVFLQTEHLGWHTDDFLVVGQNSSGQRRKLVGQVKRTFRVSANDKECKKTIQDFWKDYRNPQQFAKGSDRFVLVTPRGTNTLLEHFSGLLDCARASRDEAEFERRLSTDGFISTKAIRHCSEIRKIIGESEEKDVNASEVWSFLRVLHVLSLDLNSATAQTESTVKTLLAHTTDEPDAIRSADATWNALLREIGQGMPSARSFRRKDLPGELQQRHTPLGATEQQALRTLSEHSALILDGIRSKIGSFHLERGGLVQQVTEQLASKQVVLISGPAGSGKSVIAKDAISILEADHFAFSFRAEEFAHPHLDATLQSIRTPANAKTLGAILAGQDRKVLLVESVERLLERSTREAFTDLLTLVSKDYSWRLVLTCRDYSVDLVRSAFLENVNVIHAVVTVPPLEDEELASVKTANPSLAKPLANASLNQVLRNPYILDKALQIQWSADRSVPQSEQEFRTLFWREIVRANHRTAGGMPGRRENAFVQVSLRRARALTLYAICNDLDPEAVDQLCHDSLIVRSQDDDSQFAPAHDVMEDWAILHWIQTQYLSHEHSLSKLSTAIGQHPAVRRTYRKWVTELVELDPNAADRLFQTIILEDEVSAQFRDDTLASLLSSSSSAAFLERHIAKLLANDNQLFRQVIHLLRVACVTTPSWLGSSAAPASLFNVPHGTSWTIVLRLVQSHLRSFVQEDKLLLLGLIEDWVRSVSWRNPYPDGADSVAAIAHWLLPHFDDYRSRDQRRRVLQVIAKIPNANRIAFTTLLTACGTADTRDYTTDEFREIIFDGLDGLAAARDMPKLIVSTAKGYLLSTDADVPTRMDSAQALQLEPLFGIKRTTIGGSFPASALRGPYLQLLRYHRCEGLGFIIDVFNHSAEWYANPRIPLDSVEPPVKIRLTFADETSRTQWCNAQLWNLYRGTTVGPYVLQSILMALEHWLLEMGESHSQELDSILQYILRNSDSVALTAVVASVATAFPNAAGETLLVLLGSRPCIQLDLDRLASEVSTLSSWADSLPRIEAIHKIYEDERKEADARPHRKHNLEQAVANLQIGPFAPRVHKILDRYHVELPPAKEQDDGDRVWRLALRRMDLRQYKVREDTTEILETSKGHDSNKKTKNRIYLEPTDPEPDLREMIAKSEESSAPIHTKMGLFTWGHKVFQEGKYTTVEGADPLSWRQQLQKARTVDIGDDSGESPDLSRGGPGIVAAVCVRDHWDEMLDDERRWCVDIICMEVRRVGDQWNEHEHVQRNRMSADRPCAWVLPLLLGKSLLESQRSQVSQALVIALTHAVDEVRDYVASGIGMHLWQIDRTLALRCANALAVDADMVQRGLDANLRLPLHKRFSSRRPLSEIMAESASIVRKRFFESDWISDHKHTCFDPTKGFGSHANTKLLAIYVRAPTEPMAIAAFERLAQTLVSRWDNGVEHRYADEPTHRSALENFLLRTTALEAIRILQPILDGIDRHPQEVFWLIQGLVCAEDIQSNTAQFWSIWMLFADKVRSAEWLTELDDKHPRGREMISAIFLGNYWKEGTRHWRSLDGYAEHIHTLFEDLPASSVVLDAYVLFLYKIGERSLPDAFVRIADRLQQGDHQRMMRNGETVFHLEVLLRRFVYGRPTELKLQRVLRESVLSLLDLLVENGSSAAFRMRDDFVTPISPT